MISKTYTSGLLGIDSFLVEVEVDAGKGFPSYHIVGLPESAVKESKERIKCYKLGAQDYLTKPFNPEELDELVKKNLYPIHYAIEW